MLVHNMCSKPTEKKTPAKLNERYKNAEVAQDRLSLPEKPDFILEFEITSNPIIKGGGREYFTDDIVEIKIINYQKMVPGGR